MDNSKYRAGIYCVIDRKANDIVGGLHLFRHDAPAVRLFSDGIRDERSVLSHHPEDYELVRLGYLTHDLDIHADSQLESVLTGSACAASQKPKLEEAG